MPYIDNKGMERDGKQGGVKQCRNGSCGSVPGFFGAVHKKGDNGNSGPNISVVPEPRRVTPGGQGPPFPVPKGVFRETVGTTGHATETAAPAPCN